MMKFSIFWFMCDALAASGMSLFRFLVAGIKTRRILAENRMPAPVGAM